ncbi:recombinase family protein [Nocardia sp. 2YAB30]|uniref:recombinase family protein n=1 Tax=unclassified Nocardia TaxID=2637762 RepID=UPI003F9A5144
MDLGYARVSTTHQDLERQLVALAEHGIQADQIYADKKTGATIDRPEFAEMLKYARPGDTIVATNLDRLGRNLRECLNVIHDLTERGVGVKTLRDPLPIDTTDTSGMAELSVAMLALFAHMERVFMRERAAHAREVAAAKGKQPGRPRKLTDGQLAAARAALAADQPIERVAAAFGVSRATLYRYLAEVTNAQPSVGPSAPRTGSSTPAAAVRGLNHAVELVISCRRD